jgi:hypothetical protein
MEATLAFKAITGNQCETVTLTGAAWQQLESKHGLNRVVAAICSGADILGALREEMDWFRNSYRYQNRSWTDEWNCACDDEDAETGHEIEPLESEMIEGLMECATGTFDYFHVRCQG